MTSPSPPADRANAVDRAIRGAAALAIIGWGVFLATLLVVAVVDPPTSIDHALQADIADGRPAVLRHAAWLRPVSALAARLGSAQAGLATIAVAGAAYATRRRTLTPAVFLVGAYTAAAASVAATKQLLQRPEPYDSIGELGRSFPSGHAATAVLVLGGLALLVTVRSRRSRRVGAAASAAAAIAVVTVTILIRSAHWISDIFAGLALGSAWLGTTGVVILRHHRPVGPTMQPTIP